MKFLTDSMLGKLARFLRIFGYDTVYANDLIDYFKVDPIPDEKLAKFAQKSGRILITKDYLLFKSQPENSIYLKGVGIYNYLNQLREKLNLHFRFKIENARCSVCNSKLEKVKDKKLVENLILKETYDNYNDFYQCANLKCKKIFWKGSHIEDIENKLDDNTTVE
ncbi:MAG: Mut7-C RNAse domain-containing protein [Promethearchaeota archaeon]